MSTIVLRGVKGTPLTNAEVDANFNNLNTDKLEAATAATLTNKTINLANNTLQATSAQLAAAVSDETGSGALVFANSPTLVTPNLGTPSAATLTNATGLPVATGISGLGSGVATFLATPSSANLAAAVTGETGTGALVFGTSPTIATPTLTGAVVDQTTNLVSQADIGTAPNEIPLNQYLGDLAYQNASNIAGPVVVGANSTDAALRITQTGTGNALVVEDSANPDATPFVVNADGVAILGNTTSVPVWGFSNTFQVWGGFGYTSQGRFTNDAFGSFATHVKSRSTTIGGHTIVQNGDELGRYAFVGSDGSAFIGAADIRAVVDGTPGTNDMPGRLVFSTTADGASSPTERMRIDNAGNVGLGGTAVSFVKFNIRGTLPSASTASRGVEITATVPSTSTAQGFGFYTTLSTEAASFTLATLEHYRAGQGSFGAGSTVTTQVGFHAEASLVGATNNFGFYSNIASGTGRWNFYANGTAANVFAGTTHIGGVPGSESLRVTPVASAVNFFNAQGNTTGGAPVLYADGPDTNISWAASSKGTGSVQFRTNTGAQVQFVVAHTASAVNYVQVTGSSTGNAVRLLSQGLDTDIWINYEAKGTGNHNFLTNGAPQFRVAHAASAVNYVQAVGGATGIGVALSAQGSDTNIELNLWSKGSNPVTVSTGGVYLPQFRVAHTASAVNYLQATGGATGNAPIISAQGSDSNVALTITSKGTFGVGLYTGNANRLQFAVSDTASVVNYVNATGGATGNAPTVSAAGSDTNINLKLAPKGTGRVQYGTHTATSDTAISGYIEILDSAGNVRKLAVIT